MKSLNEPHQVGKARHRKKVAITAIKVGGVFLGILIIAAVGAYIVYGTNGLWKLLVALLLVGMAACFCVKASRCPRCGKLMRSADDVFEPFVLWFVEPSWRFPKRKCPSCGFSYSNNGGEAV